MPNYHPSGFDQCNGDPASDLQSPRPTHGTLVDAMGPATELPTMLHCDPSYPIDPERGKLLAAVITVLEGLPLCPSVERLCGTIGTNKD